MENEDFLDGLKSGDTAAFEQLYRDSYPMIGKMIRDNKGKETDAQDIFQETLIVFVKQIRKPDFKLTSKISTYLYSIAKRMWLYKLRGSKKKQSISLDDSEMQIQDFGEGELIEKQKVEEKHILMAKIFKQIGEDCQRLINGFYQKRKSMSILAEELGYTAAFVRVKKKRCMDSLKKKIKNSNDYKKL